MNLRRMRWSGISAVIVGMLLMVASAAFAQTTSSFRVTRITPSTFNPSAGQSTTISYYVPTTSNVRIAVRNSAGSEVCGIVTYTGMPAGYRARTWNGKDPYGRVLPNGTYTIVVSGTSTSGAAIANGTGTVTLGTATTTPPPTTTPPTTSAFKVNSVLPSPIDPSKGQIATISYSVNISGTCNLRISVKNSAGTVVRPLVYYTGMKTGNYARAWDGKNTSGAAVPAGTYTAVIEATNTSGTVIGTATGTVQVATSTVTPPPTGGDGGGTTPPPPTTTPVTGDQGQLVEGAGRANFDWFKSGAKAAVAFKAPKTGSITELSVPFRSDPGYGAGNYGTYTVQLQSNGSGNMPSGSVIAEVTNLAAKTAMKGITDAPFFVPIKANLTAGQIYHVVFILTSSTGNYSSLNTVMTRVMPWDPAKHPGARMAYNQGGSWSPWSSNSDPWNSGGNNNNGSHIGLVLKWSDGSLTGDPYWSAAMGDPVRISGSSRAGQSIVWNRPNTTITKVGVSVKGSGTLKYHLEKVGSGDIATGTLSGSTSSSVQQWLYATLPTAVTLQQGQTYRLWFEATSGSFTQNPVYGPSSPSDWYNASWGGPQSCVIVGSGGSWSSKPTQDLAFSLQ